MSSTIIKDNNDSSSSIKLGLNLPLCNECLIVFSTINGIKSINSYTIKKEDIQCFSKVSMLSISNCKISNDFLIGPYPALNSISLYNCVTDFNQMFSTQSDSKIKYLSIGIEQVPITTSIKFSSIKNLEIFYFSLKTIEGVGKVQLINDLPLDGKIYKIPEININNLYDLPNMDNIECSKFNINSFKVPTGGYSNIPTFRNVSGFFISNSNSIIMDLYPFSLIPKNNTLKSIFLSVKEVTTSVIVDLTNLTLLGSLYINSNLANFRVSSGKIPLVLPQSLKSFYFTQGGQFSDAGEFLSKYPNLISVTLNRNKLTGNFSEWKNYGYSLFSISNNNLQGAIDSSWCTTYLVVSDNQLSGSLPSCLSCHIQSTTVKSMVDGNSFTNLNPPPICTTLIPNFRINSIKHELELYGQDLGYSANDIFPSPYFMFDGPNILPPFTSYLVSLPQIINITFDGAKQTYVLSTIQKAPSVVMITPTVNTKQLTFDGSFFNYNKSSFSILVGSYKCNIDSASFYQVNCTIESSTYNSNAISIITINVNDYYYYNLTVLTTTIFAYLDQISFVKNCTSNCMSLGSICNTLTGQCYFNCPNNCTDSIKGTCDTSTGICLCNSKYQGNDCSIIPCDSDCSNSLGQGLCNNETGICQCSSNYQGINCSLPIKSCPNNCTDPIKGTCNTSTGDCQCNSKYQGIDCSILIIPCDSDCSSSLSQGICNNRTGICNCSFGYQGEDCSIQIKSCPNNCTDGGTCNTTTGVCNCSPNRIFSDCSGYNCTNTCEHSSTCDTTKGVCKCVPNYQGEFCTIPSHYITSVIPCSINGGEVSIDGWFGDDDDNTHTLSSYTVIIGQLDCIVTSTNKSTIKCNLGSGTGNKNIKVINTKHTNVLFIGNGLFNYQNHIKTCPNNCSGTNNGKCNSNTGECECNSIFTGFDCSKLISTSTNSTINNNTGEVALNNQDTTYEISIISLNEISFDGSVIISHQLNRNWSIDSNNTELNKFKFSQTLINNTCTITYMIEEIKNENKKFTFGTTTFTLEKDSIKLTVSINNYQYQSTLNTLQLVFYSAVSTNTDSTDNYNNNECNKKEASIDTSEVNNQQISNYIQISKNSKILVGRFINQVISDSRATFMSSTIIKDNNDSSSTSSIKLGLNLPHCNECLIDPDFSVLLSPDFKKSCNDDGLINKKKWLIPVAVVVPVVGCALISIVAFIIYKKNRTNFKILALKLKTFKNKQ
ncbi:hypothetical protein RB653_002815 [Dictyostelium firmibasis]|uniref:EGF-like domain-containing protein n=1 Tax=Dictyostelium firmibasis TaxID=79012 RepID=A0AAN7YVX9_9MYCE